MIASPKLFQLQSHLKRNAVKNIQLVIIANLFNMKDHSSPPFPHFSDCAYSEQ